MRLSRRFLSALFRSRRLWLRRTIPLAVRCPQCRLLHLGSYIQSSVCLVFLCLYVNPAAPLTADFFLLLLCFQVWSAVSDVGADVTSALCVYVFSVFSGTLVVTCGSPLLFLSIRFRSLLLWCFELFRLQFVYLGGGSSICGISFTLAVFVFCFFRPAVPQRP